MPGVDQLSVDLLGREATELAALGIKAGAALRHPRSKDAMRLESFADDGVVQQAIGALKDATRSSS